MLTQQTFIMYIAYNVWQITVPKTIEEALTSDYAKERKAAADSEYESLLENETWELVELPQLKCGWIQVGV